MRLGCGRARLDARGHAACRKRAALALLGGTAILLVTAGDAPAGGCTLTAQAALRACRAGVTDDFWIAFGNCANEPDPADRDACVADARGERNGARELCGEQLAARRDLCEALDEDRYDPDFDPANFVDPRAIGDTVRPNPYFPLVPGTRWVYEEGDETTTVTVTDATKLIEGVTCLVVRDIEEEGDILLEDTDDWYAQDRAGNVWYCGEISRNFESFAGDDPEEPELVDADGSWKAGRDGAKPGIVMLASPRVGDVYRQAFALGEEEDAAEVIGTTGTESAPAASCTDDCVVTRDFTPLEPDAEETKYYAPGVGLIVEVDLETGDRAELIEFTTPP